MRELLSRRHVPSKIMTNADFEQIVPDDWIRQRTDNRTSHY